MATEKPTEELAVQQVPDYEHEIVSVIRSQMSPRMIKDRILDYHENDIAAALEYLSKDERSKLYNILDSETLSNILDYTKDFGTYFSELGIRKKVDILASSEADTAVNYLRQLEKAERNVLIELMDDDSKREIALYGSFDEDEIGSKMTTNFVVIHAGGTIRQAMRELIDQAAEHDNISTLYIQEADGTYGGAIDLKDLIIARETTDLSTVIMPSYPYVYAHELVEDCLERIKEYSEDSIPVLSDDNRLLGVLTAQDVLEVVDDEMGEDYAKLAGLSAEEDLEEPVIKSVVKRVPWLLILLGLSMVVSSVVGVFEHVIEHLTLIMFFQSMILDMAGNVGTQSLAVTIRVLMDEDLTTGQKLRLVFKEANVGLINGLMMGSISVVLIGLYIFFLKGQPLNMAFGISACTGIALVVAMVLSSFTGTCIPILLKKLKIDPAVASGPLITTLNDLVAVVTYYGLAWILLINVLHL